MLTVNTSRAQAKLGRLGRELDQPKMLGRIGSNILDWIRRNFDAEGLEVKWKGLASSTINEKRFFKRKMKTLQARGKLKSSFRVTVSGNNVQVGTQVPYAKYHHAGTSPYTITAKGKMMKFRTGDTLQAVGAGGGWKNIGFGVKFARRVKHPGLAARPLVPSTKTRTKIAHDTVQGMVAEAVAKANK